MRDWLRENGWDDVFLDLDPKRGIVAGERWERALNEAARRCEAVIFLVSRAWLASDWCERELNLAHKLNKRLFGVLIEELAVSDIPPRITAAWQLVWLASGRDHIPFDVILPITGEEKQVTFSAEGLARLKAGLTQAGLDQRFFAWPPENEPDRAPYRGLKPLEAEDAGIFFGRDAEIIEALDRLRGLNETPPPRLLVILGASGAGKSSFMRAGLWPRLARDDRNFFPLPVIRPERSVLSGDTGLVRCLEDAFKAVGTPRKRADLRHAVEGGTKTVTPLLAELAAAATPPLIDGEKSNTPTLVFPIDQGEELFLADGSSEAQAFLALLGGILTASTPSCLAIITIRSDAYEPLQTSDRLAAVPQHTLSLPPLAKGAYLDVIEGPSRRMAGTERELKVQPALSRRLLDDIDSGAGKDALPLLAFTLERLYVDYGADGNLTLAEYNALGGIKGSIEAAVERALVASDANPAVPRDRTAKLALLRRGLIPWLAGIDPDTNAPRRRVARLSEIPTEARPLIDCLVEARLLSTDKDIHTGETTIEPGHEAFLRQWGSLRGWLEEDLGALAALEGVKRSTLDWLANGRQPGWLAHMSNRLAEAERAAGRADFKQAIGQQERNYLAECRTQDTATKRQRIETYVVLATTALVSLISAYVFAVTPQVQEIYLDLIEAEDVWRGISALLAVCVFSGFLGAWNYSNISVPHSAIQPDSQLEIRTADLHLGLTFICCLPFLGLLLGLVQVYVHAGEAQALVTGWGAMLPGSSDLQARLPGLSTAVLSTMLIVAVVYIVLLFLFFFLQRQPNWHRPILLLCYCLAPAFIILPIFSSDIALLAARRAGPLASIGLVFIEIGVVLQILFLLFLQARLLFFSLLSATLASIDWMPKRLQQGLVAVVPLAVVVLIGVQAILTAGNVDVTRIERKAENANLGEELNSWLKARNAGGRYPVFIVAAQGGGIYAASSTAAFLAMMQDHCPSFAKHVFAISGIAGGSIGASLFNAALAETPVSDKQGCDSFADAGPLTRRLQVITQDDHMSPVLAYLLPDVIRGFAGPRRPSVCWDESPVAWLGRDQILEKSFIYSFNKSRPGAPRANGDVCPKRTDASLLQRPLADTWSLYRNGIVPALILNATWVETGYRVAASPFALKQFGGGTLYSFDELKGDFQIGAPDPTLIEAAVISARFPMIMPPAALNLNNEFRLTFVDGGYVDSSGAATALQLYNELKAVGGDRIDPYLITLTDKLLSLSDRDAEPTDAASVRGWLYDFFSPLMTLLSVRDLQSRKTLKEANTQLAERMIVIKLDQKAFPLPLGWKLSKLSSDVIRFTMGSPVHCRAASFGEVDSSVFIAERNSCELKRITGLLAAREIKPGPWTLSPQ
jgi:hypothetical protein